MNVKRAVVIVVLLVLSGCAARPADEQDPLEPTGVTAACDAYHIKQVQLRDAAARGKKRPYTLQQMKLAKKLCDKSKEG